MGKWNKGEKRMRKSGIKTRKKEYDKKNKDGKKRENGIKVRKAVGKME